MISEKLASHKEQLQAESQELNKKASELRKQLQETETYANRIDSAIAALEGKGNGKTPSESTKKRRISKPSAKCSDVIQILAALFKQFPEAPNDKLYKLVEAQVIKLGFNRMGLRRRYEEALKDGPFTVSEDVISSASNQGSASG